MKSVLVLICALMTSAAFCDSAWAQNYTLETTIRVGGSGGWDFLELDTLARRLYVAHDMQVVVIDIDRDVVVGSIQNTEGVHGIAIDSKDNRGYISCGRSNSVLIFNPKTLDTLGRVQVGEKPDAIVYEPFTNRIYVMNGKSENVSVLDGASGAINATIAVGGAPEFAVSDLHGHLFLNLEDKNQIVDIDCRGLKVVHTWGLSPGDGPTGLAIDRKHHLLFSGCANQWMMIMDARSGKIVGQEKIGKGVDFVAFDPGTGLAISSNGEGTLTLVKQESADKFRVKNVKTRAGARTEALDPRTHAIYLATAEFGPAPEATAEHPHPRPVIKPETFIVLKYKYSPK